IAHLVAAAVHTTPYSSGSSRGCSSDRRPANASLYQSSNSDYERSSVQSSDDDGQQQRPLLTAWQLLSMTVLLAGIQFVWTVELGYGTPYLLSLGLSKPLMTLVWMAGPLSGLIIQPLVGRLSDRCRSHLGRRRPYIIGGAVFVVTSVIVIAYAKELAALLARILFPGVPESDSNSFVSRTAIVLAVVGFYVLDFSINTSQACARALALDIPPLSQQDLANAYAGRMLNLGSVSGYMMGFMDLRSLVPWKTNSQMQALCLIATIVFMATITWTCVCVREVPVKLEAGADAGFASTEQGERVATRQDEKGGWYAMVAAILSGVAQLPTPVQRVCNVQFFAWIAWFPFLFFATTWVTEVMARTGDTSDPEFAERATRAGSFALFLYSIASLGFSVVLPVLVDDHNDSSPQRLADEEGEEGEHRGWAAKKVSLTTMWRISLLTMGAVLLSTYFVADVRGATVLIVAMAFPWALAMWAPFALVGEYVAIASAFQQHLSLSVGMHGDAVCPNAAADQSESECFDNECMANENDDGEEENEDGSAGKNSGSTTAPSSWKQPHDVGALVAHRLLAARGDSIGSTILDDDTANAGGEGSERASVLFAKHPIARASGGGLRTSSQAHHHALDLSFKKRQSKKPLVSLRRPHLEAGTILGIHNMYVVFPQFVINAVSSLVFAWFGGNSSSGGSEHGAARSVEYLAMNALFSSSSTAAALADSGNEVVGWVLRIGGVSALVAAAFTLFLYDRQRVRRHVADSLTVD
ncbi:MFS general substrate transporter, partial [Martensiomyces pterosporus]